MSEWDVIVVGGGAAGLAAAWHARAEGASVLVVNKGLVGRTGATITSGGGVSVSGETLRRFGLDGNAEDTDEAFIADTLRSGKFLSDQRLVESMVHEIGPEIRRLVDTGVRYTLTKRPPGHSSGRGLRISGPDMQKLMTRQAVDAGARFREDFQTVGLLTHDDRVVGVGGLDRRSGESEAILGRSVVLATGGTTSNWSLRTAPDELYGEGHAMALEAGAELIDMEMLQFLPCCLVAPDIWRGMQMPWILGPQSGVRAWLLNRFGERFLEHWDPKRMELATRDVVSAASAHEVVEGRGSPNGGVYLSWAHLPSDIIDNFCHWSRSVTPDWRWEGFDMNPLIEMIRARRAVEVAPAAHFSLGGVRIAVDGATGVSGLYACGEATGALHGANRLSGNAGAQILVQGKVAGLAAARAARANTAGAAPQNWDELRARIEAPFAQRGGVAPFEIKEVLGGIAEKALGPSREGAALREALERVRGVEAELPLLSCRSQERIWNRDWTDALECRSAVRVLEAALLGALARTQSIGAHQRRDAPANDQSALKHHIVRREGGASVLRSAPVQFPLLAPQAA